MTSQTQTAAVHVPGPTLSLGGVLAGEWVKLRSLRSTAYLLAGAGLVLTAAGVATAAGPATDDPIVGVLTGVNAAELVVGAFGALCVTGEYATGTIRATFGVVPRRGLVLTAKAALVAGLVTAVAALAVAAGVTITLLAVTTDGNRAGLLTPGAVRAMVGAVLYLGIVALMGMALGWLVRSTAGALAALFALLYLTALIGFVLPRDLAEVVVPFLPADAGRALLRPGPSALLPFWAGLAVFAGYAAALLGLGWRRLARTDV